MTTWTSAPAARSRRTTMATLYAAMLPQTPTTTTRPVRVPATGLGGPAQSLGLEPAGQRQECVDDLLGAPRRGIDDDVIPAEVGEIDLVELAVPPALALLTGPQLAQRLLRRQPIPGGHPRGPDRERRPQPHAQIPVDQPPAEPAVDEHPASARRLHLHAIQIPVDRLILFRQPPQRREAQAAPVRLLPEDLARRNVPEAQRARQRLRHRALARPDLPADGDDHSDSTAASAVASSSSSIISLLVNRWATVSGCTADSTT